MAKGNSFKAKPQKHVSEIPGCDKCGKGVINLDQIKREAKELIALLDNPEFGLMTWNQSVHERLLNLHNLTEPVCNK